MANWPEAELSLWRHAKATRTGTTRTGTRSPWLGLLNGSCEPPLCRGTRKEAERHAGSSRDCRSVTRDCMPGFLVQRLTLETLLASVSGLPVELNFGNRSRVRTSCGAHNICAAVASRKGSRADQLTIAGVTILQILDCKTLNSCQQQPKW